MDWVTIGNFFNREYVSPEDFVDHKYINHGNESIFWNYRDELDYAEVITKHKDPNARYYRLHKDHGGDYTAFRTISAFEAIEVWDVSDPEALKKAMHYLIDTMPEDGLRSLLIDCINNITGSEEAKAYFENQRIEQENKDKEKEKEQSALKSKKAIVLDVK